MNEWKDTSSYSQSDKDRTPNSFTLRVPGGRLCVHRHRDYPPDVWVASFFLHGGVAIDCKPVGADLDTAYSEAVLMARAAIVPTLRALGVAC